MAGPLLAGLPAAALLLWHSAYWHAGADLSTLPAPRRYWEDLAVAATRYLDRDGQAARPLANGASLPATEEINERAHALGPALRTSVVHEDHGRAGEPAADLPGVGPDLVDDALVEVLHFVSCSAGRNNAVR